MGIVAVETDIFGKLGVVGPVGDLRDDAEDIDWISAREEEFLRDSEVEDPDLGLREKRPILSNRNTAIRMRIFACSIVRYAAAGLGLVIEASEFPPH